MILVLCNGCARAKGTDRAKWKILISWKILRIIKTWGEPRCWEAIHFSRNEQHEPHAGSFHERHRTLLPRCEAVPSAPPHDAAPSATRKREHRLPGSLALVAGA